MRFEWDEAESRGNLVKHGVSFHTATLMFLDPLQSSPFDGLLGGEERWRTIGKAGERYLLIVEHSVTEEDEEVIRIILAERRRRMKGERMKTSFERESAEPSVEEAKELEGLSGLACQYVRHT